MTARLRWVLGLGAGALGACASGSGDPATGQLSQPIVGGEPSTAGPEDAVVLVHTVSEGEHQCTGSLVAQNLVLTSRHCVAYTGPEDFQCTVQGELIENPNGGGLLGADFPARDVQIYTGPPPHTEPAAYGAQIVSSLSTSICQNDIAFIVLDRKLDLPTVPLRIGLPTAPGEFVKLVGYGSDGTSAEAPWRDRPRRRLPHQPIAGVGPNSLADGVTTVRPRVLLLAGPTVCFGDSGGPALSETSGAALAVFSMLDRQSCLDSDVQLFFTHTSPFRTLAEDAFRAAGAAPAFEGDSTGKSCRDCRDPDDSGCAVRSRAGGRGAAAMGSAFGLLAGAVRRRRCRPQARSSFWFLAALLLLIGCGKDEGLSLLEPDASSGGTGGGGGVMDSGRDARSDAGTDAADASARCLDAGSEYKLAICARLRATLNETIRNFTLAYVGTELFRDCRTVRMVEKETQDFANPLGIWSGSFWGCNEKGVTDFGIAREGFALTAADAATLIDHYMAAAVARLGLSSNESAAMRRALECLAPLAITNPSTTERNLSSCGADAGSEAEAGTPETDGAPDSSDDASTADADDGSD
jgi:hypothetical protein